MDSYLRFENVSNVNLYFNISEILQSKNFSNCQELSKEMTTMIGQFNETELPKKSLLQFKQCQVLFETFHYETLLAQKVHGNINWIEWIWGIFWLLCIEIIGNGCLFTTFAYERFGMDSQKRTVINQLLSQCCWTIMTFNITSFPVIIFRRLLGPLNSMIGGWYILNGRIFLSMISLLLSELMILKSRERMPFNFKWSVKVLKDDNLIAKLLLGINILLTSLSTLQATMLDDYTCNPIYKTLSGRNDMQSPTQICTNSLKL
jgi:hypothetical protein